MKNRSGQKLTARPGHSSMKHSATCDAVSSVANKSPPKSSPSMDNLSTPQKTPYDRLLEQIQQRRDSTASITAYGRPNGLDGRTNIGRYTLHEILGTGSFSKVQLATHQLTKGLFLYYNELYLLGNTWCSHNSMK